jgi:protein-L-isoaspartate O-methyltransferase
MATYEKLHGTRFHHRNWWHSWYDGGFRAEHLDPSREVDFEARVRFMYEAYGPLVEEVGRRFRGQGRSVDRVYARSIAEQSKMMRPEMRDRLLARGARTLARLERPAGEGDSSSAIRSSGHPANELLRFPLGLHVRDEWIRRREDAVRRLLEHGVVRSAALVETMLAVDPRDYLSDEEVGFLLSDRVSPVERIGEFPATLGLHHIGMGIEALEPGLGDSFVDLSARRGYVARLLAELVGEEGIVHAIHPPASPEFETVRESLEDFTQVQVSARAPQDLITIDDELDAMWLGAALPRFPPELLEHLRDPGGRAVTFLGPRFRPQDMVCLTRRGDHADEHVLARVEVPILAGALGWVRRAGLETTRERAG